MDNVACRDCDSLIRSVGMFNKLINTRIEPLFENPRLGNVLHSPSDISHARKSIKWELGVELYQGSRPTIEKFKSQKR